MSSLREHWDAEAANWVAVVRGRRGIDNHDHFNFPCFLRVLPPPVGPTLELGSGEGRVVKALRAGGYDIRGVDASATMVEAARRGDPYGYYTEADAAELPFDDEGFALVIAFMSLQDMDHLEGVVGEANRVLRPGGHFCFAVLHPLRTAGAWEEDRSFCISDSYFERRRFMVSDQHEAVQVDMWSEHRPLEAYTNALESSGFSIEALREPLPFAEATWPDRAGVSEKWRTIPFALHVRAAKAPGRGSELIDA